MRASQAIAAFFIANSILVIGGALVVFQMWYNTALALREEWSEMFRSDLPLTSMELQLGAFSWEIASPIDESVESLAQLAFPMNSPHIVQFSILSLGFLFWILLSAVVGKCERRLGAKENA